MVNSTLGMPGAPLKAHILLLVLCVILPVLLTGGILAVMKHSFALKFSFIILGICLPIYLFISLSLFGTKVYKEDKHLMIKAGFYSERIALDSIIIESIQIVDLKKDTQFKPMFRTNGIGLPGFNVGSFTLNNREKAFIVQMKSESVYFKTTKGRVILITPNMPNDFLSFVSSNP